MKRYLNEPGSDVVIREMTRDPQWCASALALTEAHVTLCHAGLDASTLAQLQAALRTDWERMLVVPVDDLCLARSRVIGCEHRLRTLDAIHLAAAERIPGGAVLLTFDNRQRTAAIGLGLSLVEIP